MRCQSNPTAARARPMTNHRVDPNYVCLASHGAIQNGPPPPSFLVFVENKWTMLITPVGSYLEVDAPPRAGLGSGRHRRVPSRQTDLNLGAAQALSKRVAATATAAGLRGAAAAASTSG